MKKDSYKDRFGSLDMKTKMVLFPIFVRIFGVAKTLVILYGSKKK